MKHVFGITGGIAAGKSTVVQALKERYPHFHYHSVDAMMAALYEEDWWRVWLLKQFGTENRTKLRHLAFNNPMTRFMLEAQSGMHIGFRLGRELAKDGVHVVEFALMQRTRFDLYMDTIAQIEAREEQRILRIMQRDDVSLREAKAAIEAQPTDPRSDYDFYINTSTTETTSAGMHDLFNYFDKLVAQ